LAATLEIEPKERPASEGGPYAPDLEARVGAAF